MGLKPPDDCYMAVPVKQGVNDIFRAGKST